MSLSRTTHLNPRAHSLSISDSTKISASHQGIDEKSSEPKVQDLNNVLLKRSPGTNSPHPIFHYDVENKRTETARVVLSFEGENLSILPNASFQKLDSLTLEGLIESLQSIQVCSVEAEDKSVDFSFSVAVRVFPSGVTTRENNLEGVKLFTTTSYVGFDGTFVFEAENNKEFDVEVELIAKLRSEELIPFKKIIKVGERSLIGEIKSNDDIATSWKWVAILPESANPNNSVVTSELQGVTLKQIIEPGNLAVIKFEVDNGRERKIQVEIDLVGGEEVDFKDQPRPLSALILPGETARVGEVGLKGEADVNWKFVELD